MLNIAIYKNWTLFIGIIIINKKFIIEISKWWVEVMKKITVEILKVSNKRGINQNKRAKKPWNNKIYWKFLK